MIFLDKLKIGEEGKVIVNNCDNKRLVDLGLTEGTAVKCLLKSPLGDPAAYGIRGAVIAIQKEDAVKVGVEVVRP